MNHDFSYLDRESKFWLMKQQKALRVLNGFFNTEEDNMRLEYINKLLKGKKR